jgi:hypothetical protein
VIKLLQLNKEIQFANWLAVICRNVAKDIARRTENLQSTDGLSMVAAKSGDNKTA